MASTDLGNKEFLYPEGKKNMNKDAEDVKTPDSIKPHADDYKHRAWTNYSLEELGQWVALLVKRSHHRSNIKKKAKDLHDARNYLDMMEARVSHEEDLLCDSEDWGGSDE